MLNIGSMNNDRIREIRYGRFIVLSPARVDETTPCSYKPCKCLFAIFYNSYGVQYQLPFGFGQ
ncbi:MAG: hypothetical protein AB6733_22010 [Clostridiaceae bacterium]